MSLIDDYIRTRGQTKCLIAHLLPEDMVPQSMPDASPVKWHLGHTTWFFETFILSKYSPKYTLFHPEFPHLFNSYYESAGTRYARFHRGLLTRPVLSDVLSYRESVDECMLACLQGDIDTDLAALVTVGLHHEMQHQELLLTDVLHLLSHNPIQPHVFKQSKSNKSTENHACTMQSVSEQLIHVGAGSHGFSYDCERPQHKTFLGAHALADRLVTNGEWLCFMQDKAYSQPLLWLSDGWATVQKASWFAPLYWQKREDSWYQYGLDGLQEIDLNAPVCHISYYEADAFARWSGMRLPREHELEHAAANHDASGGNFLESDDWRPQSAPKSVEPKTLHQLFGDVWEWTQSAYLPYPKFIAENGALGEYNGKFMTNQYVLKGGSCVTPSRQMRASYRNFFYPHQRWQFTGLRLAQDN